MKGMTFLHRPLDSDRQGFRALRARCSLRECFAQCLGLFCSAILCPAVPVSGIFSHCYHFSPLSGSDISFHSASLFFLTLSCPAVLTASSVALTFLFHRLVLLLRSSASFVLLWSFTLFFLLWFLPSSWLTEWLSAPWLGPVNQTVILWADRLSLPLLCC